jgi:hypothetical protein
LSRLINESVTSIEASMKTGGLEFPSIMTPCTPESEVARNKPDVLNAIGVIVAAADQLIALARTPGLSLMSVAEQVMRSLAMRDTS